MSFIKVDRNKLLGANGVDFMPDGTYEGSLTEVLEDSSISTFRYVFTFDNGKVKTVDRKTEKKLNERVILEHQMFSRMISNACNVTELPDAEGVKMLIVIENGFIKNFKKVSAKDEDPITSSLFQ